MTKKSKDGRLKQLMRLGICVALIALIALVGVVMAGAEEPVYSEGLEFTSNGDGTCYVSGMGTCTDTELVIPPVSPAGDTVTAIRWSAFYNCVSLKTVMVPASVTHIHFEAFKGCTGLTSVQFAGTSQLTSIESEAFMGCKNLEDFTIPASVTNIMSGTLDECPKLIDFEDGVGYVDQWAVTSDSDITQLTLREDTVGIAWGAFASCRNLLSVSFPESVKYINECAFGGCFSLTDVVIPAGVVTLQQAVFNQCYSLTSAWILTNDPSAFQPGVFVNSGLVYAYLVGTEEEWKDVVKSAFYTGDRYSDVTIYYNTTFDVNGIAYTSNGDGTCYVSGSSIDVGPDVVIPSISPAGDLVTRIGDGAFHDRYLLERLTLPEGLLSIGSNVIAYCPKLFSITIPASVTRIDDFAFCDGFCLKNVYFAEGSRLTSIGKGAFGWCRLTTVTLPEGLQSIDDYAFADSGLQEISLPSSVENIGCHAFNNCTMIAITVAEGNPVYHSDGNCLIHTASKTLVKGSVGGVIPNDGSVTTIGETAFWNYGDMTVIGIPSAVTRVENAAFGGSVKLEHVYYHGTEAGWNEVFVDDTNSNNEALCKATVHFLNDSFRLTSASLTLGTSLTMNYYAKADPAYGTPAMRFTYRGKTETVPGVATETEGEYVFSLTGIAPQCMGENIKAELILTLEDGTELVVDTKASYSVREYCDDALAANPDNKTLATLLADLLAYGDAAQDYTGFNADTPVSEGFAAAPSEWEAVTDTDFTLSDKTRDDIRFTSAGVRFGHINRLYFKIKAADLTGVTLTVNGKTYTAEDLALVEDTADTYILYTDPVYATEFDKVFTAELSVDGEVIQTLTYSVKSYVYAKQNGENTEMAALARALYAYGRSAIAYKQEQ